MVRVAEHRCLEELNAYQQVWHERWQQTPGHSFFQSLPWLQLYWRHFGANQQLRVLVPRIRGEVQGFLPLVIRSERTRAGSVRVLTYPLDDWGSFFGPIGPDSAAVLATSLRYLRGRPRDWDLLDLRWVNRSSVDFGRTAPAMAAAGFPCAERVWRTTTMLDFHGSWDQYLATRSPKFRANLRRAETAAAASNVTYERYRPTGDTSEDGAVRWDLFEECLELATRSWQGASQTGNTLSHPGVREFFRELFGVAAHAGALDVNLLRLDGRLIAFTYNLISAGRLAGLRIGFDRDVSHLSPGRLLLARSVADSFQRGDRLLDLGSETMKFKKQWMTQAVDCMRYTFYPLVSLRSQLLRVKHFLFPNRQLVAAE